MDGSVCIDFQQTTVDRLHWLVRDVGYAVTSQNNSLAMAQGCRIEVQDECRDDGAHAIITLNTGTQGFHVQDEKGTHLVVMIERRRQTFLMSSGPTEVCRELPRAVNLYCACASFDLSTLQRLRACAPKLPSCPRAHLAA